MKAIQNFVLTGEKGFCAEISNYGAKILPFYLSDYWSGATEQVIPAAWSEAKTKEALGELVYNYVFRYMKHTTWFDYTGKPLPALYQEVNSRQPQKPQGIETTPSDSPSRGEKILRDGQLYIMYKGTMYNVQGMPVRNL